MNSSLLRNIHWGIPVFIVITGIYYIRSKQEGFRVLGTNIVGEKDESSYTEPNVEPIKQVPSAPTLSHRNIQTHRVPISNYCQVTNHRRPDEYSTMENGTAKPFEMSSDFFYDCSPNQEHQRDRDMTLPHKSSPTHIRIGSFSQPRNN